MFSLGMVRLVPNTNRSKLMNQNNRKEESTVRHWRDREVGLNRHKRIEDMVDLLSIQGESSLAASG